MLDTAERIRHVPVFGRSGRRTRAALHVAAVRRSTRHAGPNRRASDSTAGGCDVTSTAAADLVTEDAADHGAGDGARNVRLAGATGLLALDPAPLLGRPDHRVHVIDRYFEQSLTGPLAP